MKIENTSSKKKENKQPRILVRNVTVSGGHAIIGNVFGDNADLSHRTSCSKEKSMIATSNNKNQAKVQPKLEKSSTDLAQKLTNLRLEKKLSKREVTNIQIQLLIKESELEELLEQTKSRINNYEQDNQDYEFDNHFTFLEELLNNQKKITICHQSSPNISESQIKAVQEQLTWSKNNLLHIITKEELEKICQLKGEMVKLELQFEQNEQYQTNIEITPKK